MAEKLRNKTTPGSPYMKLQWLSHCFRFQIQIQISDQPLDVVSLEHLDAMVYDILLVKSQIWKSVLEPTVILYFILSAFSQLFDLQEIILCPTFTTYFHYNKTNMLSVQRCQAICKFSSYINSNMLPYAGIAKISWGLTWRIPVGLWEIHIWITTYWK